MSLRHSVGVRRRTVEPCVTPLPVEPFPIAGTTLPLIGSCVM